MFTNEHKTGIKGTVLTQSINSVDLSKNELQNVGSLKRNVADNSNNFPNKICCSENKELHKQHINACVMSINNNTFYGLPQTVKQLFSRIRGIDTLYSKYFH